MNDCEKKISNYADEAAGILSCIVDDAERGGLDLAITYEGINEVRSLLNRIEDALDELDEGYGG